MKRILLPLRCQGPCLWLAIEVVPGATPLLSSKRAIKQLGGLLILRRMNAPEVDNSKASSKHNSMPGNVNVKASGFLRVPRATNHAFSFQPLQPKPCPATARSQEQLPASVKSSSACATVPVDHGKLEAETCSDSQDREALAGRPVGRFGWRSLGASW